MSENSIDIEKHWYAMRDLKRSNALLPAYKQLSQAGMEVFTPMVSRVFSRNGKRIRKEVPFMQDLLIVIPQDAMTRFIGATQASANPKYYAMDEISDLMCGRNIRMIGGVLDGYEGKLQTIRGSKTKHLIIILPSLLAVSVEINDEYIELL